MSMEKTTRRWLTVIALLLSVCSTVKAQTLHTVVFCNTIDSSIGKSMNDELSNVTNQFKIINGLIEYDMNMVILDGRNCTRARLKAEIDNLDVNPDDVVLTFYGGHGSHAPNNEEDPWPQYCMNTGFEDQSNWVPMASVAKWVQAKNPRLAVILSNCCNVVQRSTTVKPLWAMGGDYTKLDGVKAANYKKLFSAKGLVMATSSKMPEPSWCSYPGGGLFTCDLIQVLGMVGSGTVSPDWKSVLSETSEMCSKRDIVDRDGVHHRQHPLFKIDAASGDGKGGDGFSDHDPLGQALIKLVDKTLPQEERRGMIPGIISNYMTSYSHVLTVGCDMKTVVDNETPDTFLRRIYLSPYIQQINIISKEGSILRVHEVRK